MSVAAREKDLCQLTISVNKALNTAEAPLKLKHARFIIIFTHRNEGGIYFWNAVTRMPLMENRFVAWKFCHLLHKVLREGHYLCFAHSQPHRKMILEMGKLWGHLQDGLGECIQAFSKLLVTKLNFHLKTPFNGNLIVDNKELEGFQESDDNNAYFELTVEIFDYLDDIIEVQAKIFASINTYRMSSMTPQGQCRLAPIITLIQDANPLYDISVRLMFRLHNALPADTLSGHSARFRDIFYKLKQFYESVRPLQYFADLIQVPTLPESVPNFRCNVSFGSYVPPKVVVPLEEETAQAAPETPVDEEKNLNTLLELTAQVEAYENALKERDEYIQQLEMRAADRRQALQTLQADHEQEVANLKEQVLQLHTALTEAKTDVEHLGKANEELVLKLQETPEIIQKMSEEEIKAKASLDKFNKLKEMYTQTREEHIKLLRQHGEVNKKFNLLKTQNTELSSENATLKAEIENSTKTLQTNEEALSKDKAALENELKQTQDSYAQLREEYERALATYEQKMSAQNEETTHLRSQALQLKAELQTTIKSLEEQQAATALKEQVATEATSLKEALATNLLAAKQQLTASDSQLQQAREDLKQLEQKLVDERATSKADMKALFQSVLDLMRETQLTPVDAENFNVFHRIIEAEQQLTHNVGQAVQAYENQIVAHADQSKDVATTSLLICKNFQTLALYCVVMQHDNADMVRGQEVMRKTATLRLELDTLLKLLSQNAPAAEVATQMQAISAETSAIKQVIEYLQRASGDSMDLGDLVEKELSEMDKTIEEAAARIVEMLCTTRREDSEIKLQVNEQILDACTRLMESIKLLIKASKILQQEIVALGRGSATIKEFYKKNSQWTEGLISASKSIAKGANMLVEAANDAVTGKSDNRFEIIVAAQEIAACTAQLVVASKVKAPRQSNNLSELTKASRNVSEATGALVAAVRDCNKQLEIAEEIDLTKLTANQAKTMEMNLQVKVLELEQALQVERLRLLSFRRQNYQNTEN